jgi:hypothetical protein
MEYKGALPRPKYFKAALFNNNTLRLATTSSHLPSQTVSVTIELGMFVW